MRETILRVPRGDHLAALEALRAADPDLRFGVDWEPPASGPEIEITVRSALIDDLGAREALAGAGVSVLASKPVGTQREIFDAGLDGVRVIRGLREALHALEVIQLVGDSTAKALADTAILTISQTLTAEVDPDEAPTR